MMPWGDSMKNFVIVSKIINNADILSIMSKQEYQEHQQKLYEYEPIADQDTFEEAKQLMLHIQKIGIQAYFDEIVNPN